MTQAMSERGRVLQSSVDKEVDLGRASAVEVTRWFFGRLFGLFVRLWVSTLHVEYIYVGGAPVSKSERFVVCFLHGKQIPLLRWGRERSLVTMVSLSPDGWIQTGVMRSFRIQAVRGSSSRGGAVALLSLIRRLKTSREDVLIAVDGPKGPYGKVKPGAVALAKHTGSKLLPMGMIAERKWILKRAWDKLEIPVPFSRIQIVEGHAILPTTDEALENALERINPIPR